MRKAVFITLGSACVILGIIGIMVPVFPTTPFLLLAAFFYARSSDRALQWLLNNRWFGAYIRNYRDGRGMALRDKIITLSLLWITILLTAALLIDQWWLRLVLVGIASGVTLHLARLKTFYPERSASPKRRAAEGE